MVSLERSGLVEYAALRGYVVAPPLDAEHMSELLDARKVVESAALGRAFQDRDALLADLEEAHRVHAGVLVRIDEAGPEDYTLLNEHFRADWAFHQAFFAHAGNRYLHSMVENLSTYTHRMRQTWSGGPETFDGHIAHHEHGLILEKVLQQNHDGALRALAAHLDGVLARSLIGVESRAGRGAEPTPAEDEPTAAVG